jgi:glyoxylase-like metal-dependent hydrolase (beta-lactamase superfamily II)
MNIVRAGGTAWLVYENGCGILIDAGSRKDGAIILRRIHSLSIAIPLLFLTHTHYDHTGGVRAVLEATGAAVAVGTAEVPMLRAGYTPVPAGTGRFGRFVVCAAKHLSHESRAHYCPIDGNILRADEDALPEVAGFDMQVYPLGAHTIGSIGLRIGNAFFAGDVVFGFGHLIYPPFADRTEEFSSAWRTILDSGATMIYPGHGRPFPIERLERAYSKRFLSIQ